MGFSRELTDEEVAARRVSRQDVADADSVIRYFIYLVGYVKDHMPQPDDLKRLESMANMAADMHTAHELGVFLAVAVERLVEAERRD